MFLSKQLTNKLPLTHLAAALICILLISITLSLLPQSSAAVIPFQLPDAGQPAQPGTAAVGTTSITTTTSSTLASVTPEVWQDHKINNGDTLTSLFKRAGLNARDVYQVSQAVKGTDVLSRLYPGQTLSFIIEDGKLIKLKHIKNRLESSLIKQTEEGYKTEAIARTPEIIPRFAEGTIDNSLFYDASQAGLSDRMIMELAAIFGWDVDFALDLRAGDSFNLIYEEKLLDGELIGEGNILAAQFVNRGETYTAIRYTDSQDNTSYFTPEGNSMRKTFLRSPIDFARISSSFKSRRKHPVLGLTRAHKGTDYAARTGTPIKATGEGKIIWRGTKGGYGKCVIVQHGSNITTLYAHMSNYRKGQRSGSRIKQGDVIGYVGKTGLASGPHLHYEFRLNGVHKNPQTVKLPHAAPIAESESDAFFATAENAMAQLETYKATQLASTSN
ncbi:OapA family protein [Amphritea sp. HPY]|uniref:OapA family protein n=1 Tax=Amphritea sp. HPY TaxID=3421652 RepID=UPI003D7CA8DD